jgi:hypothetical protein
MPAAVVGIGIAAGAFQGYGARKMQKEQNRLYQGAAERLSPQNITQAAGQLNPFLHYGLYGQQAQGGPDVSGSGYAQSIRNIAHDPGYIDPTLQNAPLQQSAQRANTDYATAQGRLGRGAFGSTGGTGGVASGYALANKGLQTQRDVGIQQQYGLWREAQRRSDLNWLMGAQNQTLGMAGNQAAGQGNMLMRQQAPMNYGSMFGNAMQTGLGAWGAMGGGGGGGNANPWGGHGGMVPIGQGKWGM